MLCSYSGQNQCVRFWHFKIHVLFCLARLNNVPAQCKIQTISGVSKFYEQWNSVMEFSCTQNYSLTQSSAEANGKIGQDETIVCGIALYLIYNKVDCDHVQKDWCRFLDFISMSKYYFKENIMALVGNLGVVRIPINI